MNTAETRAAESWADFESYQAQQKAKRMRRYIVVFGPRSNPRLRLDVMAESSCAAWDQNVCLRIDSERMEVLAVGRKE